MKKRVSNRFRYCISVSASDPYKLQHKIRRARHFRPDFIELRLDYLRDFDHSSFAQLSRLIRGNEILTLRPRSEGGKFRGSENERLQLLENEIIPLRPRLIDIEIQSLRKRPEILRKLMPRTQMISSIHDLAGTKSPRELEKIASSHLLDDKKIYSKKIVRRARNFDDNFRILKLYNSPKLEGKNLIAFCTGPLGILSRVLCLVLGSPFSYASLPDEPLASGQMEIDTMREAVRLARKGISI